MNKIKHRKYNLKELIGEDKGQFAVKTEQRIINKTTVIKLHQMIIMLGLILNY